MRRTRKSESAVQQKQHNPRPMNDCRPARPFCPRQAEPLNSEEDTDKGDFDLKPGANVEAKVRGTEDQVDRL
jgi:hypothetical protein